MEYKKLIVPAKGLEPFKLVEKMQAYLCECNQQDCISLCDTCIYDPLNKVKFKEFMKHRME